MNNIFKILEELIGDIIESKDQTKDYLQSFFMYKLFAYCNSICNHLYNKAH